MIEHLEALLRVAPVMGRFHPLVPLCLQSDTEVIASAEQVAEQMDDIRRHFVRPILITQSDPRYIDRFITFDLQGAPSLKEVNRMLPKRIDAARRLLTNHHVADRIVADVLKNRYRTVALLLVDGLCYDDVLEWPEQHAPCFIDGPSITYAKTSDGSIATDVGFPAIVGTPPLARRLVNNGIAHARGYSYWDRENNDVSSTLFYGMPLERVNGMTQALTRLRDLDLSGFYIQIVREGTDGLAHRRREISSGEIKATVAAIHDDFRHLVELVGESGEKGAVYLTADHGVLWKAHHSMDLLDGRRATSPRYSRKKPVQGHCVTAFKTSAQTFFVYHYPYLGARVRSNDSGVHGGLSYWESIVPFVHVEVNS